MCAAETPGRRGVCGFQGSGGGRCLHPVVQRALVWRAAAVGSALGWSHRLSGKHTGHHTVVDTVEEEECVILLRCRSRRPEVRFTKLKTESMGYNVYFTGGLQCLLKFDRGAGAAAAGWSGLVTTLIKEKHIYHGICKTKQNIILMSI